MKAEEMFKKLDFKKWSGSNSNYLLYEKPGEDSIGFNIKDKSVSIFFMSDEDVCEQEYVISIDLLQAINKQIEELGWK